MINASPDVRTQLEGLRDGTETSLRHSPFAGVLLTDAEIDHTAGLLILRESAEPLPVYGAERIRRALTDGYPLLPTIEHYCGVDWHALEPGSSLSLGPTDSPPLKVESFAVASDAPKYLDDDDSGPWAVGLTFRDPHTGGVATYVPGLGELDESVMERFEESDVVLVDGTFWTDDELPSLGIGVRTAKDMSHLPLSGPGGSLRQLAALDRPQVVFVHINNSNPILLEDSEQRRAVEAAGIEVGYDGWTVDL